MIVWDCYEVTCKTQTKDLEAVNRIVRLLLTPIIALVGAVAGFYFGEQSAKSG